MERQKLTFGLCLEFWNLKWSLVSETADLKVNVSRTLEASHMMHSAPDFKEVILKETSKLLMQSCRCLWSTEMKMALLIGIVNGIGQLGTNIPRLHR